MSQIFFPAISTQMGNKKLLEFQDNMKFPDEQEYARPWGKDSKIKVFLNDYQKGKLEYNLNVEDVFQLIKFVLDDHSQEKSFSRVKRIEQRPINGRVKVRYFQLSRSDNMPDGTKATSPYYLKISAGSAAPDKYMGYISNTYREEETAFIRLNDADMECRMQEVKSFLRDYSVLVRLDNQMISKKRIFDTQRNEWIQENGHGKKNTSGYKEKRDASSSSSSASSTQCGNTNIIQEMRVRFTSDLEDAEENTFTARCVCISAKKQNEFSVYFLKDRLDKRLDEVNHCIITKSDFDMEYETVQKDGKKLCFFYR